jgi:hypothetical protein
VIKNFIFVNKCKAADLSHNLRQSICGDSMVKKAKK